MKLAQFLRPAGDARGPSRLRRWLERPTLVTAPAGTPLHGGTYLVPPALGSRAFHPFSDFLMHDIGTGDGIVVAGPEHHGQSDLPLLPSYEATAYSIRTAALWGLRMRSRLMHDGQSVTVLDAILRHQARPPMLGRDSKPSPRPTGSRC